MVDTKPKVILHWVKGDAGNPYNEHVDQLDVGAYQKGSLLIDAAYEASTA